MPSRPRRALYQGLRRVALALLLALSAACASRRGDVPIATPDAGARPPAGSTAVLAATGGCTPQDIPACQALYASANRRAMYPRAAKIRTNLTPLLSSTPGLVWNAGQDRILMATWTKQSYYSKYAKGEEFPLYGDTWFTAVPAVREFCRQVAPFGPDWLNLRLQQLMGLPPGADKDAFAQLWVNPQDIFRPCPDPSIFDRECQVDVPVVGGNEPVGGPPWSFCENPALPQTGAAFENVEPGHLRWICNNWCTTYCNTTGYPCTCTEPSLPTPYPWTALGYTYDWGRPDAPEGQSEYVVPAGKQVVFDSVDSTAAYCSPRH